MSNYVLIVILVASAALLFGIGAFLFALLRKLRNYEAQIRSLFERDDVTGKTPAETVVERAADTAAVAMMAHLKTTVGGIQSGQVRGEKAVEAALAMDGLNLANPLLGGILSSMPALQKLIKKNPALLDFAVGKLAGRLGDGGPAGGNNHQVIETGQSGFDI